MTSAVSKYGSFDDYAASETPGWNRAGGDRLKNWKKDGEITIWLPLNQPPLVVWRHQFPIAVTRDKDKEATLAYWMRGHVCWESEATLKDERKRVRETGARIIPPTACPLCKMQEWLYQQVKVLEKIDWMTDIFRFDGATNPKDNLVLKAGGMLGFFGSKFMSEEEKAEMAAAGVKGTEAWKQKVGAKPECLVCVVDNNEPDKGIQTTFEPISVGEAIKDVLRKAVESRGPEASYSKKPYAIKLKKDPNAKSFNETYDAVAIEKIGLSHEIEAAIIGQVPDLSMHLRPFNGLKFRAFLEKHALIKMPFDEFFSAEAPNAEGNEDDSFDYGANEKELKNENPPGVELAPCDSCNRPLAVTATKCVCGAEYAIEEEPPPPPVQKAARRAKMG